MIAETTRELGEQPAIVISLFRALDMRLMLNTGAVTSLAETNRVIVLAPDALLPTLRESAGPGIVIEPLRYASAKYGSGYSTAGPIRRAVESLVREAFRLTYARPPGRREHWTRALHVRSYREGAVSPANRCGREVILALAAVACRSRLARRALRLLAVSAMRSRHHDSVFQTYRPSLVVVCSLGLELDARLMVEARRYGVPSVAVVQSWDKTSSKGYPLVDPDRILVWSDVMAEECDRFLDLPRERIEVVGAPVFDVYFDPSRRTERKTFLKRLELDPDRKTIFCALCSPSYHDGNLALARHLADVVSGGHLSVPANLVLRVHPAYYENATRQIGAQRRELFDLLAAMARDPAIHVNYPDVIEQETSYVINPADADLVANILAHCDVSVSVLSTQMVEAAIFDKPAVTVEYGIWSSNVIRCDLSEYRLEHLERVMDTGAVERAASPSDLTAMIDDGLRNPARRSAARRRLVEREASIHRGKAASNIARALDRIAATGRGCPGTVP
jgi:hypothetical protein